MHSLTIDLPTEIKQYVEAQVASGRHTSASEYVRELILADEKRQAEVRLETLLLEGLQGEETPLTPADWSEIRQAAVTQLGVGRRAV